MAKVNVTHEAIHYDKTDRTFSVELSSLGDSAIDRACSMGSTITAVNPKTGNRIQMIRFKVDKDSDGDVHGYWYRANVESGQVKFLFIND